MSRESAEKPLRACPCDADSACLFPLKPGTVRPEKKES
jgi:hypothetical protein